MEGLKKKIQAWWNSSPCCSGLTSAAWGSREFFQEVDSYKDTHEPFTNRIADYGAWKGKKILEIGCGLGKDFSRFAAAGAKATCIDLSLKPLELTRKRLETFGLEGNHCLADAENLPFKDGIFDLGFSWGVIHHTPDTQKAVREIYRCLRPGGGRAIVMLYNKVSLVNLKININYFIRSRLNLLRRIKTLLCPWRWFTPKVRGGVDLPRIAKEEFLAQSTDGVGNPFSTVYSRKDALRMFSQFRRINVCAYGPKGASWLALGNCRWLEKHLGWFMVIIAEK
jgi:ubiquinone/menaquinone biosynthesis C-methylase UbiE